MNRLAGEKSPYLLQHKNNPVNWYPWGQEALNKAKAEGKPIFLSIGYSTCHWCHVMNRESFSQTEVAEVLNKYFIPIKVDREERPDIDKVYMEFSQAMTGSGGWPLNVVATPEGEPFTVVTYLPKKTIGKRIGIIDFAEEIHKLWINERTSIVNESRLILKEVESISNKYKSGELDESIYEKATQELRKMYDEKNGGFGTWPKFPMPQYILFLLGYGESRNNKNALDMAESTLEKMYKGGIFDHIGYGFFRYSVDERWLVPHFEKMLYDNALMALVYTKAYEITGKLLYRNVAEKIYEFVIRDFLSNKGGIFSALDAESEGVEGKYYLLDKDEVLGLLDKKWGEFFCNAYDITEKGNFEGTNIPNLIGKDLDTLDPGLKIMIEKVFTYRKMRPMPHRDEKILTSWNGLIIGSLAYAGIVFKNHFYIEKAKDVANFILKNSIDDHGSMLSTYGISIFHYSSRKFYIKNSI